MPTGSSLNAPEKPTFWSFLVLPPLESLPLVQPLSLAQPTPAGSLLQAFRQPQGEKPTGRLSIVSGCQVPGNNSSCGEPAAFSGELANAALREREEEAGLGADLQAGSASGCLAPTTSRGQYKCRGPRCPHCPLLAWSSSSQPQSYQVQGTPEQAGRPMGKLRLGPGTCCTPRSNIKLPVEQGGQSSCLTQAPSGQGTGGCAESQTNLARDTSGTNRPCGSQCWPLRSRGQKWEEGNWQPLPPIVRRFTTQDSCLRTAVTPQD